MSATGSVGNTTAAVSGTAGGNTATPAPTASAPAASTPATATDTTLKSDNTAGSMYSGRGAAAAAAAAAAAQPVTTQPAGGNAASPTLGAEAPVVTAPAKLITNVRLQNTAGTAQANVPFTFGQVFAVGHLSRDAALSGRLENGETLPLQIDAKAFHPDGSVRHAIVSGVVPSIGASQVRTMELMASTGKGATSTGATTAQLLDSGFTASISATMNGVRYSASADSLIKAGKASNWLAGANANEWLVSAPLTTDSGVAHPHLTARFAIRWFDGIKKARVDVTVENNWAYEPAPSNFTYDAEVLVNGKNVYSKAALTHMHHARWRKVFWQDGVNPDAVVVKHDTAYLIGTGAVANYDQSIVIKEATLAGLKSGWTGTKIEPMNIGTLNGYMPSTGGRPDIGLMPAWSVMYLLSMDSRAKMVTLGHGDLAGTWSMHYRDKITDRPISIIDFPYMTIQGRPTDTQNPVTKKRESFPACATTDGCTSPFTHDMSHQPSLAYLPYIVTGDYYYLEELQFWAMYNVLALNPNYREQSKGILQSNQVRGQAWGFRSLAEAAYITPDADRLKTQFVGFVNNNLAWYNKTYTDNVQANQLGALINGAFSYKNGTGIAPWQDDFFTQSVGHAMDMGFPEAKRLLAWKAKFPMQRMTDGGLCWVDASMYSMAIRDTNTAPLYTTMQQVAVANQSEAVRAATCASAEMGKLLGNLKAGEMTGYSSTAIGYPSNMQPALAYAVSLNGAAGQAAWATFMSRSVKPDYTVAPQFAIVPR